MFIVSEKASIEYEMKNENRNRETLAMPQSESLINNYTAH